MISRVTPIPLAYGLEDLVAGVAPTYVNFDNDPTDGANIVDNDNTTLCSTGDRIILAWQYVYFEWNLGAEYDILIAGYGSAGSTAGTWHAKIAAYIDGSWQDAYTAMSQSGTSQLDRPFTAQAFKAAKIRLGLTSSSAATITPHVHQFSAWRLK